MFVTGALLFTGYASAAYQNPFFRIKMSALTLAGLNALMYHLVTERGRKDWDAARPSPRCCARRRDGLHRPVGGRDHVRADHVLHHVTERSGDAIRSR